MLASWPPTSGARRISVARTTPVMGGGASGRNRRYPPTPAATRMKPNTKIRALAIGSPPLDQRRRHHGKREIDDREGPQPGPIARHLPQGRAELADPHESVDREIRGEDVADGLHRLGDRFPRPGEAGQKE